MNDSADPVPTLRELPFEFRGSGSEYFRIWIVNLLLTIITIGIYSAWAKVRRLRYFYGSTQLEGSAFEYHGQPLAILKGRLIAFGLYLVLAVVGQIFPLLALALIPALVFGVPWIIVQSRRFQMHMSSYRGVRFGFDGRYPGALRAFVGYGLLALLTLYLLLPLWLWARIRFVLGNARYGTEPIRFTATRGSFFGFVYATFAMLLALVFVAGGLLGVLGGLSGGGDPAASNPMAAVTGNPLFVIGVLGLFVAAIAIGGYYQKSLINRSFGSLHLGPHRVQSTLRGGRLAWIYVSNFLLILVTLGLYYPWAQVRQFRYQIENTRLLADGSLDDFSAAAGDSKDAVGEEVSDFFDVDVGI